MKVLLSNMKKGQSGIVQEINLNNSKEKIHILEMGLTKGIRVKVKKIAPTGDPISIEIRSYELCISKENASKIVILR